MDLRFREPSKQTRKLMCKAAMQTDIKDKQNYIKSAENEISSITGHEHAKVVNSGNAAILASMSIFKDKIMVPDQGGWTGFKNAAEFLGLKTVEVPTDIGIIIPGILEEFIHKYNPEALFITSFAGYIAEQPVKDLFDVCNDNDVILVEDASGGIGDSEKKLANGDHAHIIVGSTGSPKIVNVGSGGFISTDNNEIFRRSKFILKSLKADAVTCAGIGEEIKNSCFSLKKAVDACLSIKKELKSVVHKDKRGISIALKADDSKKAAYLLRQELNAHGRNIITMCPRYDRLLIDGVCVEIKNIDVRCLQKDNIKEIVQIIKRIIDY